MSERHYVVTGTPRGRRPRKTVKLMEEPETLEFGSPRPLEGLTLARHVTPYVYVPPKDETPVFMIPPSLGRYLNDWRKSECRVP